MREMITPQQKSTAWKQVSLSLVKDSLTVLNNKRWMESEMFYPLTFQLPKHEHLQQASMKTLMVFSSCLLSITCQTGMCIVSYFVSLQTDVKEDIVELWVCFVHFMSYSLNLVTNFLCCHLHRHTQEHKNEYKEKCL